MSDVINLKGDRHAVTQCITCGVWHTVPEIVHDHHREDGGYHYCPSGHSYGWREGTKAKDAIRLERDRLKQQIAQKDDEIRERDRHIAERDKQIVAAKGELTKARKRAAAGTCPCCKRTIGNMARHMKTKHPDFDPAAPIKLAVVNS